MADWIAEGCSERSAVQIAPARHLLVEHGGEWSMWCSGGKGVRQTPVVTNKRFCRECLTLANEAIEDETLDPSSIQGWPVRSAASS